MENEIKKISWDNPDILWGITDQNTYEEVMGQINKFITMCGQAAIDAAGIKLEDNNE